MTLNGNGLPPTNGDRDTELDTFPIEPRYHPVHRLPRKIYDFLASARLAMGLLVIILGCCVAGVTIWRGAEAGRIIFSTFWFNAILVLLVVNVACCFFGRIWGRRVTLISFGMILFHLSFVTILLGIAYNSMFYFRGNIRLTEGEALPSSDPHSYDSFTRGSYFSFSRIKGETKLVRMHSGYRVSGEDKRAAYEIAVGEGRNRKQGIIFITNKLTHHGFDYFNDREGYSLLLILSDRQGKELYGGHQPLQSITKKDGGFVYTTGYKDGAAVTQGTVPFPAPPETPRMALQVTYAPSKINDRGGESEFTVYRLDATGKPDFNTPIAAGKAPIGGTFAFGEYQLSVQEVRYWVGMTVRYEPGKPIVLISLWTGLSGMIITTVGRMLKGRRRDKLQPGGQLM